MERIVVVDSDESAVERVEETLGSRRSPISVFRSGYDARAHLTRDLSFLLVGRPIDIATERFVAAAREILGPRFPIAWMAPPDDLAAAYRARWAEGIALLTKPLSRRELARVAAPERAQPPVLELAGSGAWRDELESAARERGQRVSADRASRADVLIAGPPLDAKALVVRVRSACDRGIRRVAVLLERPDESLARDLFVIGASQIVLLPGVGLRDRLERAGLLDLRQLRRVPFGATLRARCGNREVPARALDLSDHGMRVLCADDSISDAEIVDIPLAGAPPIRAHVRSRWLAPVAHQGWQCGLRLVHVRPADAARLRRIVSATRAVLETAYR